MEERRVVITGLGVIAPNGVDKDDFWKANCEGVSGVDIIKSFDTTEYNTKIAAEIKNFEPAEYTDKKNSNFYR